MRCNCESAAHFDDFAPEYSGLSHAFLAVPAGHTSHPYIGAVCDECFGFACLGDTFTPDMFVLATDENNPPTGA